MDATETTALIDKAGGPSAFGRLLGLNKVAGWRQKIHNWKTRGMPAQIVLDHYEAIAKLKRKRKR